MKDRVLVVNGDDFGLTPGVNAGILDAHRHGILTSASLFANAPATEEAIAIARRTPTLGVGCHLTLVDGIPVLPPDRVPTLAPGGAFRPTWARFLADALRGRIRMQDVERELDAQLDRLRSAGIELTHLDGHKHVHVYPPVFAVVARLARRVGIRTVRVPCEHPAGRLVVRHAVTRAACRQALENVALAPWAAEDRRRLAAEGLPEPPRFFGRVLTGLVTRDAVARLVESLPIGVSELMTHPGYVDSSLAPVRTRLREARAIEVAALVDDVVRGAVDRSGVRLRTHADAISASMESHTHAS